MPWKEIPAPELPDTFPRPPAPPRGSDVAWFVPDSPVHEDLRELLLNDDVYVYRIGNGGTPPFGLVVFTVARDIELGIRWPTLPELWAIGEELTLEGALLTFPAQIVGMELPDVGAGSMVTITQVGAMRGTPAGRRFELAGGAPSDSPAVGLIQ